MKILIVEDEKELVSDIKSFLSAAQFICEVAYDFDDALEKMGIYKYDCILLDLMLPGGSGLDLLRKITEEGQQDGVIIISARSSVEDKIAGLQIGADDYLAKPFHHAELLARINSVIRRKKFKSSGILQEHEVKVDLNAQSVVVNQTPVILTKKEYALLLFFIGNKNKVLSKAAIAEHLSGDFADMMDDHNFVYAHVKNLKRKLKEGGCESYIQTIYGTGYKWEG